MSCPFPVFAGNGQHFSIFRSMFHLNAAEPQRLTEYLQQKGWLKPQETVLSAGKPGAGNMNYVLRIDTGARTLIIKQSRPYVEKYPQVPAPAERALVEGAFYNKIASNPEIREAMPGLLGLDPDNYILALEDLGESNDFTFLYERETALQPEQLTALATYLHTLHASFVEREPADPLLSNRTMRTLNHEHIFYFPFLEDTGFELDVVLPGLQELAMPYKKDTALKQRIQALGTIYLNDGNYLLHGDYYPGSWLNTSGGVKIIDPEFCFYGHREFDVGVLLAHLHLAEQPSGLPEVFRTAYAAYPALDQNLLAQFTGVEMMRRLIGLAQLPLTSDLATRRKLLALAHHLIMNHEA